MTFFSACFYKFLARLSPIKSTFPSEVVGSTVAVIPNHQNVMVAYDMAKKMLHNSVLTTKHGDRTLGVEIKMSRHSYVDLIQATNDVTPKMHFHLMSLFFEQMSYRFNPNACYDLVV